MHESVDYFSNHALKLKFPWKLYHAPIIDALRMEVARTPGLDVLNVGSGPFFELDRLPRDARRYSICDIDERALDVARALHGPRLHGARLVTSPDRLPYDDRSFDLVAAMEVIEHLPDARQWLREIVRVTRPNGRVFITTPNYGFSTLGVIERTALEAVARFQGFTRKDLHPNKMTARSLEVALEEAGLTDVSVRTIAFDWVLVATAQRAFQVPDDFNDLLPNDELDAWER